MAEMRIVLQTVTISKKSPIHAPRARLICLSSAMGSGPTPGVLFWSAAAALTAALALPPDSTHLDFATVLIF